MILADLDPPVRADPLPLPGDIAPLGQSGLEQVLCDRGVEAAGNRVLLERASGIGKEGAKFMTYYAEQSCTAGRTAFFTGMTPLRAGMIPPQLPGSPSFLQPGTPSLARFLLDLGYSVTVWNLEPERLATVLPHGAVAAESPAAVAAASDIVMLCVLHMEAVERSVADLFEQLRSSGVPVAEFAWSRKTKESLVTKLLVKRETSAARVFDRLRDECGFTGGYTIIKDYMREREQRRQE